MKQQHEEGWVCPFCDKARGPDLHDPCLGKLPGVKFACCGHGGVVGPTDGYIFFESGRVVRFSSVTHAYDHKEKETT